MSWMILFNHFLDYLKQPLAYAYAYVSRLDIVTVIRMEQREGLIKARLVGLSHVTTPVVIFLDSHCECFIG